MIYKYTFSLRILLIWTKSLSDFYILYIGTQVRFFLFNTFLLPTFILCLSVIKERRKTSINKKKKKNLLIKIGSDYGLFRHRFMLNIKRVSTIDGHHTFQCVTIIGKACAMRAQVCTRHSCKRAGKLANCTELHLFCNTDQYNKITNFFA